MVRIPDATRTSRNVSEVPISDILAYSITLSARVSTRPSVQRYSIAMWYDSRSSRVDAVALQMPPSRDSKVKRSGLKTRWSAAYP
jgi:hypothetical protein